MDITGTIKLIRGEQQVSDKFVKREFVLTENSSQYPQYVTFQLTPDGVDLISKCRVGDEIKVHFNIRGREWTNPQGELKHFNTLDAWRLEGINISSDNKTPTTTKDSIIPAQEGDDLPF